MYGYLCHCTERNQYLEVASNDDILYEIIKTNGQPGKIFIGPLTSDDAEDINNFCSLGIIFFSFASKRKLASDCVYLINFFPEDDLRTLFNHFDINDRVALLYPENHYGYYISNIIDNIAVNSKAILELPNTPDIVNYIIEKHEKILSG